MHKVVRIGNMGIIRNIILLAEGHMRPSYRMATKRKDLFNTEEQ